MKQKLYKLMTANKLGVAYIYWKGIKTNYMIDYLGDVYNYKRGKFLYTEVKHGKNGNYHKTKIYVHGGRHTITISREMMKAFRPCENMENLEVDHINQNETIDCLTNFQWLTKTENIKKMHEWRKNPPF